MALLYGIQVPFFLAGKRVLVVPIWKNKGNRQDCNNYREITLLIVPEKMFAHLLLMRVRSHLLKYQIPTVSCESSNLVSQQLTVS